MPSPLPPLFPLFPPLFPLHPSPCPPLFPLLPPPVPFAPSPLPPFVPHVPNPCSLYALPPLPLCSPCSHPCSLGAKVSRSWGAQVRVRGASESGGASESISGGASENLASLRFCRIQSCCAPLDSGGKASQRPRLDDFVRFFCAQVGSLWPWLMLRRIFGILGAPQIGILGSFHVETHGNMGNQSINCWPLLAKLLCKWCLKPATSPKQVSYDRPLHAWTARRRCVVHQPAMQKQMPATGRLRGLLRSALRSGKFLVMLVIFGKDNQKESFYTRIVPCMLLWFATGCLYLYSQCARGAEPFRPTDIGLGAGCVILGFKVYAHTAKNVPNSSLQHVGATCCSAVRP